MQVAFGFNSCIAPSQLGYYRAALLEKAPYRRWLFLVNQGMNVFSACLTIGFSLVSSTQAPLSASLSQPPALTKVAGPALLAVDSTISPPTLWQIQLPPEKLDLDACKSVPTGLGIPGFPPGLAKSRVLLMFGVPTETRVGYWPNTKAVVYELIPGRVSLGFLFDRASERLRQPEVSFADTVEKPVMLRTLNSMLGCRITEEIKAGFEEVRTRKSKRFDFALESLEGVIERDDRDRIYIGIWEADLH